MIQNLGDKRQVAQCAYCGRGTSTRDHVPSRVLLDVPYPTDLPVVPACQACNEGFSLDEEYVACLIDCVLTGTSEPDEDKRDKIRQILIRKPLLVSRLAMAHQKTDKGTHFDIEENRVRNIVMKMGRGHALFELNEPRYEEPSNVGFTPLSLLTLDQRSNFEKGQTCSVWAEVGSRAMQRAILEPDNTSSWVTVQPGRYRYMAFEGEAVVVRVVLSEYLACEVAWDNR